MQNLYDKEREKIDEKLKKLEKQKLFKNKISVKQRNLTDHKKQHNELTHDIKVQKKKLKDLQKLILKLRAKYDT